MIREGKEKTKGDQSIPDSLHTAEEVQERGLWVDWVQRCVSHTHESRCCWGGWRRCDCGPRRTASASWAAPRCGSPTGWDAGCGLTQEGGVSVCLLWEHTGTHRCSRQKHPLISCIHVCCGTGAHSHCSRCVAPHWWHYSTSSLPSHTNTHTTTQQSASIRCRVEFYTACMCCWKTKLLKVGWWS